MGNASTQMKMPIWITVMLWFGLACIGQFFICAFIGVIRGYSIQSWIPFYVMLGGLFISGLYAASVLFITREKRYPTWISWLSSFCIITISIVGILQGRYQAKGDKLYKQKDFPAAITMYQKEIGTWYLRINYNYREDMSLFGIAQSYCQLENFEQARQTYQYLTKMSRGYYRQRAGEELAKLDRELGNIADLEKQLADGADDNQKAQMRFDMALSYRIIGCAKRAREQYALIQTLNVRDSRKEQAKEFAADPSW